MHILTLSTLFPNALQPLHAVFVRARMEHFVRKYDHRWTVVAPVPYFPRLPLKIGELYSTFARVPAYEDSRGYPVHHPRYLVTPKVGMRYYGSWMTSGVRRQVLDLHDRDPFDVIDGHYVYPDGTAATRLGEELGLPVVLSSRGTDLNLYPGFPAIAPRIRDNLEACDHLICVCEELKRVAVDLGTPERKISVIGNGVDPSRFHRGDRDAARARLALPKDALIVLSVGHMTERKGFDLLIEACARLGRDDVVLVIAGDGPARGTLERLAGAIGFEARVRFPGAVRNEDLPAWYQASDLFALASSREGWPNVLCEAQACGLPAVATRVWGIPEIIHREDLGVLVEQRNADGLRAGLESALSRTWDRDVIESVGRSRTWDRVAEQLATVFEAVGDGDARPRF